MNSKKWLILFFVTALVIALGICAFNIITDPFGVFGDPVLEWWSYDITNNPRTAKFSYLDKYHDRFDSYIVGCSSTSSFPVDAFNEYLDAKFYNTIVYGADMLDSEQMINYIIDNYGAKYIIFNLYIDNAIYYNDEANEYTHCMPAKLDDSSEIEYYTRFLFANPEYGQKKLKYMKQRTYLSHSYCIFDEETGSYEKRRRDIEPISDIETFYEAYPVFTDYPGGNYTMPYITETVETLKRIKEKCDENGVTLYVVAGPVYSEYMDVFREEDVIKFYSECAKITGLWDFSYSSVSFEPRYYYDGTHFRNNIGYMMAARMFGDESFYIPDDFGHYVSPEEADEYFENYFSSTALDLNDYTADVPILMYHHLASETNGNEMIITPSDFEAQIKTLAENGYTAITFTDAENYVRYGAELPENPIIITFDDGYYSNYEYAYPVLSEYGMKATIFTIGCSVGKDTYKDTGKPINPHFGEKEIREMTDSGIIDIQSHTYDMHMSPVFEGDDARTTMKQLAGESEDEYISAIRKDIQKSREQLSKMTGEETFVLAYPEGYYNDNVQRIVKEEGIRVTLSTRTGVHKLIKGLDQSLLAMRRIDANLLSPDELIEKISAK